MMHSTSTPGISTTRRTGLARWTAPAMPMDITSPAARARNAPTATTRSSPSIQTNATSTVVGSPGPGAWDSLASGWSATIRTRKPPGRFTSSTRRTERTVTPCISPSTGPTSRPDAGSMRAEQADQKVLHASRMRDMDERWGPLATRTRPKVADPTLARSPPASGGPARQAARRRRGSRRILTMFARRTRERPRGRRLGEPPTRCARSTRRSRREGFICR